MARKNTEVEAYNFDDHANNASKNKISTRTRYQAAEVNQEFSYQILRSFFVDENYDVLTLIATDPQLNCPCLPSWLSFDPETGYLSGTPTAKDEGSYIINIGAIDFFGVPASYDLTIKVWPAQTSINTIEEITNIFPNPCKNDYITVTIGNYTGNVTVSFCDIYGKILSNKTIQSNNGAAICDVTNLSKGLYFVKISANNSVYYQKLIIE